MGPSRSPACFLLLAIQKGSQTDPALCVILCDRLLVTQNKIGLSWAKLRVVGRLELPDWFFSWRLLIVGVKLVLGLYEYQMKLMNFGSKFSLA